MGENGLNPITCGNIKFYFTKYQWHTKKKRFQKQLLKRMAVSRGPVLTGSAVITHGMTTGTGYCLVGFNWIIDVLN